jgi:hypothetical protein
MPQAPGTIRSAILHSAFCIQHLFGPWNADQPIPTIDLLPHALSLTLPSIDYSGVWADALPVRHSGKFAGRSFQRPDQLRQRGDGWRGDLLVPLPGGNSKKKAWPPSGPVMLLGYRLTSEAASDIKRIWYGTC